MTWQQTLAAGPRNFALDYIYDWADPQLLQLEANLAKYPLVITGPWTDKGGQEHLQRLQLANPTQVRIAYVCTNHLTGGPLADVPVQLDCAPLDPLVHLKDGTTPWDPDSPPPSKLFLYDFRKDAWRTQFLESCREVMQSWRFDGLFLDNCSVWNIAIDGEAMRRQMNEALQDALLTLRGRFPQALLIGNANTAWSGLNGEMLENPIMVRLPELQSFAGHAAPEIDMLMLYSADQSVILPWRMRAKAARSWFCAQPDAQHPV